VAEASNPYLVPAASAEAELRERGSRFRAFIVPVDTEEAAAAQRKELGQRFGDATHLCWAQRIGEPPVERYSDAGEPAGTAGQPMLQILRGAQLSDVLAVVVRWFGGVKLGKGGLARAYSAAVHAALQGLRIVERVPCIDVAIEISWEQMGAVERLVRPPAVEIAAADYAERVTLRLRVQRSELDAVLESFRSAGIPVRVVSSE